MSHLAFLKLSTSSAQALYLDELHEDNEEIDLATNRDLLGMQTQLRMSGQAALDFFVSEAAASP